MSATLAIEQQPWTDFSITDLKSSNLKLKLKSINAKSRVKSKLKSKTTKTFKIKNLK